MPNLRIDKLYYEAKAKGLSVLQADIARTVGISQGYLSQIMKGDRNPSSDILQSIADYFTEKLGRPIQIDDLIERSDHSVPPEIDPGKPNRHQEYSLQLDDLQTEIDHMTLEMVETQAEIRRMRKTNKPLSQEFAQRATELQHRLKAAKEAAEIIREMIHDRSTFKTSQGDPGGSNYRGAL